MIHEIDQVFQFLQFLTLRNLQQISLSVNFRFLLSNRPDENSIEEPNYKIETRVLHRIIGSVSRILTPAIVFA